MSGYCDTCKYCVWYDKDIVAVCVIEPCKPANVYDFMTGSECPAWEEKCDKIYHEQEESYGGGVTV